ncbi:helix-turn-helix domain-containing protein [Micromonospora matsumotoense]|uniref:helix-turn-helix domain-containing protein n=1 Tax=Micromonospora matsumotoense TaxID=121616 RepID=UPI003408E0C7
MTYPGQRDRAEFPIGRQVARWRVRRRMTQQVFADRLGKSKSWVDKVERGVRALDRYSVIQEIAEVLHLDPAILLGPRRPRRRRRPAWTGLTRSVPRWPATTGHSPGPSRATRWNDTSRTPG